MLKKIKSNIMPILLLVFVIGIGIGVKKHMDKVAYENKEVHKAEVAFSKKIISEFKGIKKIEFKEVSINDETGFIQLTIAVNDSKEFGYSNPLGQPSEGYFASSYEYLEKTPLKEANRRDTKQEKSEIDLNKYEIKFHSKIDRHGAGKWTIEDGERDKDDPDGGVFYE